MFFKQKHFIGRRSLNAASLEGLAWELTLKLFDYFPLGEALGLNSGILWGRHDFEHFLTKVVDG